MDDAILTKTSKDEKWAKIIVFSLILIVKFVKYERIESNILGLSETCGTLGDLDTYFLCTNNVEIATTCYKI